ncbi:unnamed protein product, partial [Ectocarpus sp. 4 AP-2014]
MLTSTNRMTTPARSHTHTHIPSSVCDLSCPSRCVGHRASPRQEGRYGLLTPNDCIAHAHPDYLSLSLALFVFFVGFPPNQSFPCHMGNSVHPLLCRLNSATASVSRQVLRRKLFSRAQVQGGTVCVNTNTLRTYSMFAHAMPPAFSVQHIFCSSLRRLMTCHRSILLPNRN